MLGELSPLLAVAVLAPVWHLAGRAAQHLQLPAITGIMMAGVASGPQALGLISFGGVQALGPLQRLCLSLIALAAGAELHLPELRRLRKQVACLTAGISICSWVFVYICMLLLAARIPFAANLPPSSFAAVCTLTATLTVARSPASAIAVLKEVEGKGPYCSLVMAVVVVKDVLLFAAFAVNVELARAFGKSSGSGMHIALLLEPLGSIVLSVGLGTSGGYCLSRLLRMRHVGIISIPGATLAPSAATATATSSSTPGQLLAVLQRVLRHPGTARLRPLGTLLVSGLTFAAAELFGAEPLLACVAAGLMAANWRNAEQQGRDVAEVLAADLTRLMPLINAFFFGLVGASLKLSAVRDTLWAAIVLYVVRLVAVWVGCWMGAEVGGTPPEIGRRIWMGMVTQAGIALGLAQEVSERFPVWGPDFAALVAGVVLMNLLTGPPMFKSAVVMAGESRALALPVLQTELHKRSSSGKLKHESVGALLGGVSDLVTMGSMGSSGGGGSSAVPTIPVLAPAADK